MTTPLLLSALAVLALFSWASAFTSNTMSRPSRTSFYPNTPSLRVASATEEATTALLASWDDLQDRFSRQQQTEPPPPQQQQPLVTLYRDTNGWCPFCERIWLALEVKQIPYQTQLINLRDKPDWFLQMVPTGLVPAVLIHSDLSDDDDDDEPSQPQRTLVWESLDILEALDEHFPDTPQLIWKENDAYDTARTVASQATTAGVQLLYGGRNATAEETMMKRDNLTQALQALDTYLATTDGPFLLGSQLSGVDLEMVPTMERWRYQLPLTANMTVYSADAFPNIVEWYNGLQQVPAYTNRVAGDAYSWTATASTFLRFFGSHSEGGVSDAKTQTIIDQADAAATALRDEFLTSAVYQEDTDVTNHDNNMASTSTTTARHEAAAKILSNHEAIAKDCTNVDPQSQQDLERAGDVGVADAMLRATVEALLSEDHVPPGRPEHPAAAAQTARTVAARLCVPRDMGAPAAQVLRRTLTQLANDWEKA